MSLVASRVALRHRTTIERDMSAGPDSWGGTGDPDWQPHVVDVPCRAWVDAAREPIDDRTTVVVKDRRVLVERDVDVTEADRIGDVTERGVVIFDGPMRITGILRRPSHAELLVEQIL